MGCLGSFVSVGGPEGHNVVVEKKVMSVIMWQLVGLSRCVHFAKPGVKLLPLD